MSEHYHYTECGLDDVYLVNGVDVVDGRMTIHEIDGLHRAIGQWLVTNKKSLSGAEMRFLRHELELSQASLARMLGVTEQSVLRWEKKRRDRGNGSPAAERALRMLYLDKFDGDTRLSETLEMIADLEDEIGNLMEFSLSDVSEWREDHAA
ncbi:MAG: transcriptional regulator [Pseudomonadota bacterium]